MINPAQPNIINRVRHPPPRLKPPSPVLSGLKGAMPKVYDRRWQTFTDLDEAQREWYMAQAEWADFNAWVELNPRAATIHADTPDAVIRAALIAAGKPVTATDNKPVIQL